MENYFIILNSINVNENKKKKKDLDYLSWAWAWCEVKKVYPDTVSKVYERDDGRIYWDDGKTAWVKVGVTVQGLEHIEYLPIMDYSNKSIKVELITSMDVNKSIQRALTKAIARHGIGLYIYAGEDLPEEELEPEVPSVPLTDRINQAKTIPEIDALWLDVIKIPKEDREPLKEIWTQRKKQLASNI